jgi:hypothetical protein
MNKEFVYTSNEVENWFYARYFYDGQNSRYYTFQVALNLLNQRSSEPLILETGCQREEEDVGAGMSTSIFAEYIQRYGGNLISVDNEPIHLNRARGYMKNFPEADVQLVQSDSVEFLRIFPGSVDLLYLDSLDYPVGDNEGDKEMERAAQEHNLNEFLAIEEKLAENTIVLLDDNTLPSGGKPRLLKEHLLGKGWTCLLDLQQSLWIRSL